MSREEARRAAAEDRAQAIEGALHVVDENEEYFAITLTALEDGQIVQDVMTEWAGPHTDRKGWELRRARVVTPGLFDLVYGRGNYLVVHDEAALAVWLTAGGPALVKTSIAQEHLADLVEPGPSVADPQGGYRDPSILPASALRRQPNAKLRMAVMKRDGYRCRLCGRDADDSVDIRLHLHHVRPWALGGLTEEPNLITLCQTCHEGLNPHYEVAIIPKAAHLRMPAAKAETAEGVRRYRELMRGDLLSDRHDAD